MTVSSWLVMIVSVSPPALPMGLTGVPAPRRPSRGWIGAAIITITAYAIVSGWIAIADDTPPFAFDEVHHLLMARMTAGFPAPDGSGAGYFPAWGVLLTPLWWIADDPAVVYALALFVGWLVGLATIPALASVVRRARLGMAPALTVSALVMLLPARLVQSDVMLSEPLLMLTVSLAALTAFRLWEEPSHLRAVLFALAVGAVYFTHVRMLTLVLASAVWLAALLARRWTVAVTGLISLAGSYALFDALGSRLDAALRRTEMSRGESFVRRLDELDVGLLVRAVTGQVWGQTVGTFGLFVVGLVVLAVWCWREVRRGRLGRASWILGSVAAAFAVSVLTWANPARMLAADPRLDVWVYGRYVEPVTALVVAFGIAAAVRGLRTSTWLWSVASVGAICLAAIVLVAPVAPTWGRVTPAHIGGVLPWSPLLPTEPLTPTSSAWTVYGFWVAGSTVALVITAAARITRRKPLAFVGVMLVASLAAAVPVARSADAYRAAHSKEWAATDAVRAVAEAEGMLEIAYDYRCRRPGLDTGVGMNQLSFQLLPNTHITPYFRDDPVPTDVDAYLSCIDDPDTIPAGALPLADFVLYSSRLWIPPGPLQDELRERGALDTD